MEGIYFGSFISYFYYITCLNTQTTRVHLTEEASFGLGNIAWWDSWVGFMTPFPSERALYDHPKQAGVRKAPCFSVKQVTTDPSGLWLFANLKYSRIKTAESFNLSVALVPACKTRAWRRSTRGLRHHKQSFWSECQRAQTSDKHIFPAPLRVLCLCGFLFVRTRGLHLCLFGCHLNEGHREVCERQAGLLASKQT